MDPSGEADVLDLIQKWDSIGPSGGTSSMVLDYIRAADRQYLKWPADKQHQRLLNHWKKGILMSSNAVDELREDIVKKLEAWIVAAHESECLEEIQLCDNKYPLLVAKAHDFDSLTDMFKSLKHDLTSWEQMWREPLLYAGVPVRGGKLQNQDLVELLREKRNKKELVSRRNEAVEALEALKSCARSANLHHLLRIGEQDELKLEQLSSFTLDSVAAVPEPDVELAALAHEFNAIELLDARASEVSEISTMKSFHQVVDLLSANLAHLISEVDKYFDYDGASDILSYTEPPLDMESILASSGDLSFIYESLKEASTSFQEFFDGDLDDTLKLKVFQQASSVADELLEIAGRLLSPELVERYMQLIHKHLTAVANAVWKISRLFSLDSCVRDKSLPFPMGFSRFLFTGCLETFCGNCEFGAGSWRRKDMMERPGAAAALAAAQAELAKLKYQLYETCGKEFKGLEAKYLNAKTKKLDARAAIGIRELELHLERAVYKVKELELKGKSV